MLTPADLARSARSSERYTFTRAIHTLHTQPDAKGPMHGDFTIDRRPYCPTCYPTFVRKTSVYLTEQESARLAELARSEGRSQAEIIREAITAYVPVGRGGGEFALAVGFQRTDDDPRPISEIPEDELLDGFGR